MHLFIVVLNPIDAICMTLATKVFFVIQLHLNGCCNLKFKYLCKIPHINAPFGTGEKFRVPAKNELVPIEFL